MGPLELPVSKWTAVTPEAPRELPPIVLSSPSTAASRCNNKSRDSGGPISLVPGSEGRWSDEERDTDTSFSPVFGPPEPVSRSDDPPTDGTVDEKAALGPPALVWSSRGDDLPLAGGFSPKRADTVPRVVPDGPVDDCWRFPPPPWMAALAAAAAAALVAIL